MKALFFLKRLVFTLVLLGFLTVNAKEPIKVTPSINFYCDLSDSYGKGSLFGGTIGIAKLWYGLNFDFGYFQGLSTFIYNIEIEDLHKSIEIQFDEISNMRTISSSLLIIPIQKQWIKLDINCGVAFNSVVLSQFDRVDYSYDLISERFTYLYKDYKLVKKTHFGYQVGFDLSFYIFPKLGLQVSSRIQDLNNGGTFFFTGGGLCFRI